jgi:hypothetical protein
MKRNIVDILISRNGFPENMATDLVDELRSMVKDGHDPVHLMKDVLELDAEHVDELN